VGWSFSVTLKIIKVSFELFFKAVFCHMASNDTATT